MAEGRMLKKKVSTSKKLMELKTDSARLLWTWILPHLDVEGKFSADPDIVKGSVVPRLKHFTPAKVEEYLLDMANNDLIIIYEVNGDRYLKFNNFENNQTLRVDREAKSSIPDPVDNVITPEVPPDSSVVTPGVPTDNAVVTPPQDKISKDKISKDQDKASDGDGKEIKYSDSFEEFWKVYPKKIGKGAAYKSWKIIKPSDVLKEKIINAVKMQCNSIQWQKEGGQYIPNPSTWLNQERWNDELKYNNVGSKYAGLGRDL